MFLFEFRIIIIAQTVAFPIYHATLMSSPLPCVSPTIVKWIGTRERKKNKEKSIITRQVWHSSKGSSFSYLWRNFLTSMTTAGVENNKSKEWRLYGIGEKKGEWRRFEQRIQFHNWRFYLSHDPPFYMLIILVIISIIIHFLCNMHNLFCCTYYIFM